MMLLFRAANISVGVANVAIFFDTQNSSNLLIGCVCLGIVIIDIAKRSD